MPAHSFAHVPEEGFLAFAPLLSEGPWATIDTTSYDGAGQSAAKSLCDAPALVISKLRIARALAELGAARGGADVAKEADTSWDGTQKRLGALLLAASHDPNAEKRAAAARLQKAFLRGTGTGQTKLRYQQEVDFGRTQLELTKEPQHTADITLLDLEGVFGEIQQSTDALADAIGHGEGTGRRPSERRRAAVAACASTFTTVADALAWTQKYGTADDLPRTQALLESLFALAKRYPAPSSGTTTQPPTVEPPKEG
ncbi:hypothetical protein [Polyangium spumosum]|uniref:Uncharacterized protein n=1 Tax=Polyangium spumosum TaxID=889282 RepID=A0A6N7PPX0_9BACT|nr:hypothetical protein [Polyangium spumosum]MRG92245.1 hypothetical protein [Polyangium spumosum]